jgi:hypothetical protein
MNGTCPVCRLSLVKESTEGGDQGASSSEGEDIPVMPALEEVD